MARPKEHRPEMILDAAITVFQAEGVTASTAQIAKQAGVSNGSLFNYFPTKQALIDALYLSIKHQYAEAIDEPTGELAIDEHIRHLWNSSIQWARENRQAHEVMTLLMEAGLASSDAQAEGERILEGPMSTLMEAQKTGLLVDLPLDYIAALILQQLGLAIVSELHGAEADIAFDVLWNGITKSPNAHTPTREKATT